MTTRTLRASTLFTALFVLSGWLAAPHASQDGANEGFILFTSDRANPSELGICPNCEDIYVMSPNGSNPARLTYGGADAVVGGPAYNNGGADWSHNRKLIAFQSNRVGGIPQIYTMDPDGSEQQLLVSLPGDGAAFPAFSPTGDQVCFHSQDVAQPSVSLKRRDIYIVNSDGTGLTNITSPFAPGLAGDNIRCDWSRKGDAIVFTSTRDGGDQLYSMNSDGSGVTRLTGGPDADRDPAAPRLSETNGAWSPGSDLIAFESNRTYIIVDGKRVYRPEIWVMNADGSNPVQLTDFSLWPTPTNILVTKPTWSPKGDRIAFHRRVGDAVRGHAQIYTMNADGSDVTQITNTDPPVPITPQFSGFPSWGKWSAQN